jgi:hypothetical protein
MGQIQQEVIKLLVILVETLAMAALKQIGKKQLVAEQKTLAHPVQVAQDKMR